jgi:hypothetical protein
VRERPDGVAKPARALPAAHAEGARARVEVSAPPGTGWTPRRFPHPTPTFHRGRAAHLAPGRITWAGRVAEKLLAS